MLSKRKLFLRKLTRESNMISVVLSVTSLRKFRSGVGWWIEGQIKSTLQLGEGLRRELNCFFLSYAPQFLLSVHGSLIVCMRLFKFDCDYS